MQQIVVRLMRTRSLQMLVERALVAKWMHLGAMQLKEMPQKELVPMRMLRMVLLQRPDLTPDFNCNLNPGIGPNIEPNLSTDINPDIDIDPNLNPDPNLTLALLLAMHCS